MKTGPDHGPRWQTLFEESVLWGAWRYRVLHDAAQGLLRTQNLLFGRPCLWRTFVLDEVDAILVYYGEDSEYVQHNFWIRLHCTNGREPFVYSIDGDQANALERIEACLRSLVAATGLPTRGSFRRGRGS